MNDQSKQPFHRLVREFSNTGALLEAQGEQPDTIAEAMVLGRRSPGPALTTPGGYRKVWSTQGYGPVGPLCAQETRNSFEKFWSLQ